MRTAALADLVPVSERIATRTASQPSVMDSSVILARWCAAPRTDLAVFVQVGPSAGLRTVEVVSTRFITYRKTANQINLLTKCL